MRIFLILSLIVLLSSCGGGGGGGGGNGSVTPSTVSPTVNQTAVPLATSVPSMTYTGFAQGYVSALNSVRSQIGVGLLAQDTSLDYASEQHAYYLYNNYCGYSGANGSTTCNTLFPSTMNSVIDPLTGLLYAHSESNTGVVNSSVFYSATPASRDVLAGYTLGSNPSGSTSVGEVAEPIGGPNTVSSTELPNLCATGEGAYSGAYPAVSGERYYCSSGKRCANLSCRIDATKINYLIATIITYANVMIGFA